MMPNNGGTGPACLILTFPVTTPEKQISDAEDKPLKFYVCDVDSSSDGCADKYTKETVIT